MTETTLNLRLEDVLATCGPAAVAVSGGVDSMTLAYVAHLVLGRDVEMFHAVSPAVPPVATERVRRYADQEGWTLRVLNAGEFGDERYLLNPANRCFFCKSNLYGSLSSATDAQLLSGTNMDDLGDWRPGLQAAKDRDVRHPFVEAGLAKSDVRALARRHGLADLAELPSAPCLSSRVETGIRINADALRSIDRTESMLRDTLSPETARCRVRGNGIVIELDQNCLDRLDAMGRAGLIEEIRQIFDGQPAADVSFAPYQRGSTFLRETLNER
ncbi:MAG: adenine nucleotide alpha hydrolase [Pseudomonadota bacterium]